MILTINNQRPGVYSRYNTSSTYVSPRSGAHGVVVAKAAGGDTDVLHAITSLTQLGDTFSPDAENCAMSGCVRILLQSGVGKVYAVAVGDEGYAAAFERIEHLSNIGAVVSDCTDPEDLDALKASVLASSQAQRERIAYCGVGGSDKALSAAAPLDCERVVLCCPAAQLSGGGCHAAYSAAALAGKVLAENDPLWNLNGEAVHTVNAVEPLEEAQIQELLKAGVTVLEQNGGAVQCVRALTTRTAGGTDYALRGLNAILCIDNVMQEMRAKLQATLRSARLRGQSLQAVRSQATVVLEDRRDSGVIESYETPAVAVDDTDPTVCVVELTFRIAHVVSQIHVTAHIQV